MRTIERSYVCDRCAEVTILEEGINTISHYTACGKCNNGYLVVQQERASNNSAYIGYSYGKEKGIQPVLDRVEKQRNIARRLGMF